jgi:hypothetical protein
MATSGHSEPVILQLPVDIADETLMNLIDEVDGERQEDREAGRPPSLVLKKLSRALDEFATTLITMLVPSLTTGNGIVAVSAFPLASSSRRSIK